MHLGSMSRQKMMAMSQGLMTSGASVDTDDYCRVPGKKTFTLHLRLGTTLII